MKSILDPTFRYVPSVQTDLRKTFARVRREQRAGDPDTRPAIKEGASNVLPILQRRQAAPARIR
jgi:hypothetical protein